jgi:hypothetical protein
MTSTGRADDNTAKFYKKQQQLQQQRALPLSHGWVRLKDETKHACLLRFNMAMA